MVSASRQRRGTDPNRFRRTIDGRENEAYSGPAYWILHVALQRCVPGAPSLGVSGPGTDAVGLVWYLCGLSAALFASPHDPLVKSSQAVRYADGRRCRHTRSP